MRPGSRRDRETSGAGKTRMVMERLWQLRETMRPMLTITGHGLQSMAQDRFQDPNARERWRRALSYRTLVIDELGRSNMTPQVESALFELIDHRYRNGGRIVFTTNFTGKEIEAKMNDGSGALLRRLRDKCVMINAEML